MFLCLKKYLFLCPYVKKLFFCHFWTAKVRQFIGFTNT